MASTVAVIQNDEVCYATDGTVVRDVRAYHYDRESIVVVTLRDGNVSDLRFKTDGRREEAEAAFDAIAAAMMVAAAQR